MGAPTPDDAQSGRDNGARSKNEGERSEDDDVGGDVDCVWFGISLENLLPATTRCDASKRRDRAKDFLDHRTIFGLPIPK